jgi:hypothetical protein
MRVGEVIGHCFLGCLRRHTVYVSEPLYHLLSRSIAEAGCTAASYVIGSGVSESIYVGTAG